jgi:hypothetical protein
MQAGVRVRDGEKATVRRRGAGELAWREINLGGVCRRILGRAVAAAVGSLPLLPGLR